MRNLFFTTCLLTSFVSQAQIQIDSTSANALVEEFLIGSGVLIDNIEITGIDGQIRAYSNAEFMSLDSGLVMSSGHAENLMPASGVPLDGSDLTGDDDLLALANSVPPLIGESFSLGAVYDVCSIEFDFIPYGDSLSFTYAFASKEYGTWEFTQYNDVFGFFLAGAGISGPYSAPEDYPNGSMNIAVVPGSDPPLPITVSSVNAILNEELYVDCWLCTDMDTHGYTVPMMASVTGLEIGSTYHIRLAIADGSDSSIDSVVLLEAGTFSSYLTVSPGDVGDVDGDGDLDMADLLQIIASYGCDVGCEEEDLDGDGVVGMADILLFLGIF